MRTEADYKAIIGSRVRIVVDRPLGSAHPKNPKTVYPVNYGYVPGVPGGDGAEQDVYLLGVHTPVADYGNARIIAVYHRFDDVEDKWIAAPAGMAFSDSEILSAINFMERFFTGRLYR